MKHKTLSKDDLSNFNVILGALYDKPLSEHPRILNELRIEFDLIDEVFGRPMNAKTPSGDRPARSVGDTWSCLLPNYELESKTQPILPMFRGDTERTIYILTLTNKPLEGSQVDCALKHFKSDEISFHLGSQEDSSQARIISMFHYIHPRLKLDLTRHRIKLVQMTGIEDFYTLFLKSVQIAADTMSHTGAKIYHERSNAKWPVPKEEYSWESVWFQQFWALYKDGGAINYPMYQYLNPDGAGVGAIYDNLEIIRTGDLSRVHQLPLPISGITICDINLWHISENYEDLATCRVTYSERARSRFWPEGLAENWPEDTIRPANIHTDYAAPEIQKSLKGIFRGGCRSGYR